MVLTVIVALGEEHPGGFPQPTVRKVVVVCNMRKTPLSAIGAGPQRLLSGNRSAAPPVAIACEI